MADVRRRVNSKGKIVYQVRFADPSNTSGYGYRSFPRAKDAHQFAAECEIEKHNFRPRSDIDTVPKAIDKWLDICITEGTQNHEPITRYTQKTYAYRAEIMKRYDWPVPLPELRPSHIQEFKSWLLRNCAGRHQAMKVLSSFHSVIKEMHLRDVVVNNVATGISITMASRYRDDITPPSEKEVFALLEAADRLANSKDARIAPAWQRYRPILYLAADTGARPQEYLALPNRNLARNEVRIDQAIERGGYSISATKTAAGRRWIDISPHVADMIRHYADHHAQPNDYDLIFPAESGRWQCPGHWRKRGFHKACEEAGLMVKMQLDGETVLKPKFTPYDLRHFYASMLIEQKTNLKRIQKLLGHEDIKTTLNNYGHLIERAESSEDGKAGLLERMAQK